MGFLRIFGGGSDDDKAQNDGNVVNFELLTFMREAFGKDIKRMRQFAMPQYSIDFLLIDNDMLVTNGLSAYAIDSGRRENHYELAIRVPFKWDPGSSSLRHIWFVNLIKTLITQSIGGISPIYPGFLQTFDQPFHYTTELNSVTLYNIAEKHLQNGTTVNFLMVVPLYESELDDGYYKQDSSDLKGLAWQQASLIRGNEYFDTLDNYYPYDDGDTEAMSDYFALRDETLPGWNPDTDAVGCRVSSSIVNSKTKIGYMYRARPEGDFSGWYFLEVESGFLTGDDDLPIDYYADSDSDLFTVAFLFPQIAPYLKSLPGSVYELQENGKYAHIK
ncbi:MAG: DUF2185 domain-containing protein [Bacteroidales bacterium]|nr:DUF2185 domain-containing protein [Bacteroidales bacterium]